MGGADARPPRARGDRGPAVRLRRGAEDRRARDLAALPRRRARARRHARQRRGGGGRHAQPAHDPLDPAALRRRAAADRGARRDLHVAVGLHRAQRAPRRGRARDVHEPAQLGRRHDPPARPAARRRAPALDVVLRDRRHRGDRVREPLGVARVAAEPRVPRQRRRQAAHHRGRGGGAVPGVAGAPRRARLRDRRRRGQGRRLRAAAAARRQRPRPALGDRVEVPAHHRGDQAQRDPLERRQVRRPAPVRGARAGARRRRHREDGDAAQRGGRRAQGHPGGRRGDRAARRRRDPAGALARAARAREPRPLAAHAAARALPVLRHADGQGGLGLHAVPEPRVPRAALAAAEGVRRDHGRRRARREAGRAPAAGGARQDVRRLLPPHPRADHGARGLRRGVGRQADRGHPGLARAAVRARAVRARDRGRRLRHRPQPRPALPHRRCAAGRHAGADRRDARASARRWRS